MLLNNELPRKRVFGLVVAAVFESFAGWPLGMACVAACTPVASRPAILAPDPFPVAPSASQLSRLPDAVVLDAWPVAPTPVSRADARGVVSLREPVAESAVIEIVEAFVGAWGHESLDGLLALATSDAGLIYGVDHSHAALVESWRQRLRAHNYGRLEGSEVVRRERVERWEWDQLGTSRSPARPQGMQAGELLIRAPIEVTRVGDERVFGDVLVMILRRQEGRLRIVAYGEVDGQSL